MPKGIILDIAGNVLSQPGEFNFSDRPVDPDETVYELFEAHPGGNIGLTLGIQLIINPHWIMVTGQIPGGGKDDVMLAFLRGDVAPPKGTRFALRMLPPEDERPSGNPAGGTDGTEKIPEGQGGQGPQDAQGDERVQGRDTQVIERPEGDEPEAGGRDRHERVWTVPENSPKEAIAFLARHPELRGVLYVD